MTRSNDSVPVSDMPAAPSSPSTRQPSRSYGASRSASFRPKVSLVAFQAGRHSRAVQLSWMGLIRR